MRIINKVGLAVFKDKKILLVRSKKQELVFFTLGGKLEKGESEIECLKREVFEEVGCELDESSLKFLSRFEDKAHGKDMAILNLKMYKGELVGKPNPLSEIAEIGWFDSTSDKKHLSEITQIKIFPWLKIKKLIN